MSQTVGKSNRIEFETRNRYSVLISADRFIRELTFEVTSKINRKRKAHLNLETVSREICWTFDAEKSLLNLWNFLRTQKENSVEIMSLRNQNFNLLHSVSKHKRFPVFYEHATRSSSKHSKAEQNSSRKSQNSLEKIEPCLSSVKSENQSREQTQKQNSCPQRKKVRYIQKISKKDPKKVLVYQIIEPESKEQDEPYRARAKQQTKQTPKYAKSRQPKSPSQQSSNIPTITQIVKRRQVPHKAIKKQTVLAQPLSKREYIEKKAAQYVSRKNQTEKDKEYVNKSNPLETDHQPQKVQTKFERTETCVGPPLSVQESAVQQPTSKLLKKILKNDSSAVPRPQSQEVNYTIEKCIYEGDVSKFISDSRQKDEVSEPIFSDDEPPIADQREAKRECPLKHEDKTPFDESISFLQSLARKTENGELRMVLDEEGSEQGELMVTNCIDVEVASKMESSDPYWKELLESHRTRGFKVEEKSFEGAVSEAKQEAQGPFTTEHLANDQSEGQAENEEILDQLFGQILADAPVVQQFEIRSKTPEEVELQKFMARFPLPPSDSLDASHNGQDQDIQFYEIVPAARNITVAQKRQELQYIDWLENKIKLNEQKLKRGQPLFEINDDISNGYNQHKNGDGHFIKKKHKSYQKPEESPQRYAPKTKKAQFKKKHRDF